MNSWKNLLSKNLKEIRFVFCQKSPESAGARRYVHRNYLELKEANPEFPIIIRECQNAAPNVMARYDFGVEKRVFVDFKTEKEIEEIVQELVEQADKVNSHIQK